MFIPYFTNIDPYVHDFDNEFSLHLDFLGGVKFKGIVTIVSKKNTLIRHVFFYINCHLF